MLIDFLKN